MNASHTRSSTQNTTAATAYCSTQVFTAPSKPGGRSEDGEALGEARSARGREQQRPGEAVGDGEPRHQRECLRRRRGGHVHRYVEGVREVAGVDDELERARGQVVPQP